MTVEAQTTKLLLEELDKLYIWQEVKRRVLAARDRENALLQRERADAPAAVLQRRIGVIEGINRVLGEPDLMDRELTRAINEEKK